MDYTKLRLYFTVPIGVLYVVFFSKLVDKILNYEKINDMCKYGGGFFTNSFKTPKEGEEYNNCFSKQQLLKKDLSDKKFTIMMIIGFLGLILGSLILKRQFNSSKYDVIGFGLALGGAMSLVYSVFDNWRNMNDSKKLITSGIVLATMMGSSYVTFQ